MKRQLKRQGKTGKGRPKKQSLNSSDDLVTSQEQMMSNFNIFSQAKRQQSRMGASTVSGRGRTNTAGRTNTNTRNTMVDLEDNFAFDQLMKDGEVNEDDIKISKEEGQVIQKILQIARKGKINTTNAFELEMRTLDPKVYGTRGHFWRFASDLLKASMSIYDKRVENVSLSTQRVKGKIERINLQGGIQQNQQNENTDDADNEIEREDKARKQKKQNRSLIIEMDIKQFTNSRETCDSDRHLENPAKLNIQREDRQFHKDFMHCQKLKAFDNSSANSLLMNISSISINSLALSLFQNQVQANELPLKTITKEINDPKAEIKQEKINKQSQIQNQNHFLVIQEIRQNWSQINSNGLYHSYSKQISAIFQQQKKKEQQSEFSHLYKNDKIQITNAELQNLLNFRINSDKNLVINAQGGQFDLLFMKSPLQIRNNTLENSQGKTYEHSPQFVSNNQTPNQTGDYSFGTKQNQPLINPNIFQRKGFEQNQIRAQQILESQYNFSQNNFNNCQLTAHSMPTEIGLFDSFMQAHYQTNSNILSNPYQIDYEFKKSKLVLKKAPKKQYNKTREEEKNAKKSKKQESNDAALFVDFLEGFLSGQDKTSFEILDFSILKRSKTLQKKSYVSQDYNRNLQAISLQPYEKLLLRQIQRKIRHSTMSMKRFEGQKAQKLKNIEQNQIYEGETNVYEVDDGNGSNIGIYKSNEGMVIGEQGMSFESHQSFIKDTTYNTQQNFDLIFGGSTDPEIIFKQTGQNQSNRRGYASIRSIRPEIIARIENEGRLLLSEYEWKANIGFQSMLIIWLNLANQRAYVIKDIQNGDVQLSLPLTNNSTTGAL